MRTRLFLIASAVLAAGRGVLACSSDDDASNATTSDASADASSADDGSTTTIPPTDAGSRRDADADAAPVTCSTDNWCYQSLPEAGSPLSVSSIWVGPDHRAWAVTSDGSLLGWDTSSWNEIANLGSSLHSITGTSATDLWIAGDGVIAHGTVAAGKLSLAMVPVDPYSGYQTIVAGASTWVLGSDGNVYRLDPRPADAGTNAGAPFVLTQMVLNSDYPGDSSNFRVTALWGAGSEIWMAVSDQTYCDITSCQSLSELVLRKWLGGANADSSWSRVRLPMNDDGGVLPMYSSVTNGITTTDDLRWRSSPTTTPSGQSASTRRPNPRSSRS